MNPIGYKNNSSISIHALREEGDARSLGRTARTINFYPRPPRGGRPHRKPAISRCSKFLSTPSARRATTSRLPERPRLPHFYPRPPRGGRLPFALRSRAISTFLSTPSARRATRCDTIYRAEDDFYPRPPRGGRLASFHKSPLYTHFYPRPPRGGRPLGLYKQLGLIYISIHALREEGDLCGCPYLSCTHTFLSTPSARRATNCKRHCTKYPAISIHALREEGDFKCAWSISVPCYFYPRPPRGGRLTFRAAGHGKL